MIPAPPFSSFQLGPFTIHLYGLILACAIAVAYYLATKTKEKYQLSSPQLDLYVYVSLPLAFLVARLYYVLININTYISDPLRIFAIWEGGIGIFGGLLGGALGITLVSRYLQKNVLAILDFAVPLFTIGQVFGRIGNYFNQELYGQPTNAPWGLFIDVQHRYPQYSNYQTFHPTFLYESILNLLNFAVLIKINQSLKIRTGTITAIYLINYSLIRLVVEHFRINSDTSTLWLGIKVNSLISVFLFIVGITLLKHIYTNKVLSVTH